MVKNPFVLVLGHSAFERISMEINLLSIDVLFIFLKKLIKIQKGCQLISSGFQLIFLLKRKDISKLVRISVDINLRSIDYPF